MYMALIGCLSLKASMLRYGLLAPLVEAYGVQSSTTDHTDFDDTGERHMSVPAQKAIRLAKDLAQCFVPPGDVVKRIQFLRPRPVFFIRIQRTDFAGASGFVVDSDGFHGVINSA